MPMGVEIIFDKDASAHAYRFSQSTSALHIPSSQIFPYCDYFPEEFSVLIHLKMPKASQSIEECIFSLKPADNAQQKLSISLNQGTLLFHYVDRLTQRLRVTAYPNVDIFDNQWHTLIITAAGDTASLTVDCGKRRTKRLKRSFPALLNTMGTNIYMGNCNTRGEPFAGLLKQLFILPGSDASVTACPPGVMVTDMDYPPPIDNAIPEVPVTYADRTWCTWRDTGRMWFDLHEKALKVCYSGIWQVVLPPPEQRHPVRLDYVEWHQDLIMAAPTIDLEIFRIPMEGLFMAAASYSDHEQRKQQSAIFKWEDGRFVMYQSMYTLGAQGWEHFTIDDQFYLAVANRGTQRDRPSKSVIYRWNKKKKRFRQHQELVTWTARDIEHFEIEGKHFIAVANHVMGQNHSIKSDIFGWDSAEKQFSLVQQLPTVGAYDWTHFKLRGYNFLVVANSFTGPPLSSTRTNSDIYFWENGHFVHFQSLTTTGATDWEFFKVGTDAFLVVSNAFNFGPHTSEDSARYRTNSTVYKLNKYIKQFETYQEIDTWSAVDWESFTVGDDVFIIVSNAKQHVNGYDGPKQRYSSVIYRYQGMERFVPVHYLDIRPSADWEWFSVNNQIYLVYANAKDNLSQVLKIKYV